MENVSFSLDAYEAPRVIKWLQIAFGIVCILTATGSLFLVSGPVKSGSSFWISFIFLFCFGLYQINSGTGRGRKYLEIKDNVLVIKKTSFLPPKTIADTEIDMISVMPLSIVIKLKNRRKFTFRLGTAYTDIINPVRKAIIEFSKERKLAFETVKEEI